MTAIDSYCFAILSLINPSGVLEAKPGSMERDLLAYLLDKDTFPQRDLALPTDPGGNAVVVKLGLTLNQLMDVVSANEL